MCPLSRAREKLQDEPLILPPCLLFLNCLIIELHDSARLSCKTWETNMRQQADPGGNKEERRRGITLQTSSSPLCRCTARKTWSPSRGSNNKYFPMQETQCDKFGVSGGLGEPRFGLKLWLGSMDRMDESSSKSWVLFRGLPYRAIVIGVDL